MFGLKSLRKAVADAEMWRQRYDRVEREAVSLSVENIFLRAELARWKPGRDMKGRFTHTAAVMPGIAGRDCSFIERGGGND